MSAALAQSTAGCSLCLLDKGCDKLEPAQQIEEPQSCEAPPVQRCAEQVAPTHQEESCAEQAGQYTCEPSHGCALNLHVVLAVL